MTNGAVTGAGGVYQAVIAQAVKASGAIVQLEPKEFETVLTKVDNPLVVTAKGGFIKTSYQYLTGYKGFVFFTKSLSPLHLRSDAEVISAKTIWIPT